MKKVVATLIIKDKEIINLSVNDNKGHLTTLTPALTHFNNVKELYNCVLKVLKNNGFLHSSLQRVRHVMPQYSSYRLK